MKKKPIIIKLLKKQRLAMDYIMDKETTELGYGGSAGGGKTVLGCLVSIFYVRNFAGTRWAIGRKELKNLKRTTLVSLFEQLHLQGFKNGVHFNYNQQDSVIRFVNGSEIILFDMAYQPSDPMFTRFGSYELTGGWVDESNESDKKAIQILKTRFGRKNIFKGKEVKPFSLETFNPNKGHVYTDYYKPWKNNKLPDYRKFIKALPSDNHHLPKSYIENLKRADKVTKERLLYGNFEYDNNPAKLFNYDAIGDLFSNFIDKQGKSKDCLIVDVARLGKDEAIIDHWRGWDLSNSKSYGKCLITELFDRVEEHRELYKIPKSRVFVDEGGVGGGLVDMGGYVGFVSNARPCKVEVIKPNGDKEMVMPNFNNLKSQCCFYMAKKANNHEITISCEYEDEEKEKLIADLDSFEECNFDKETKRQILPKDKQKEKLGRSPDRGDTFIMRAFAELMGEEKATIDDLATAYNDMLDDFTIEEELSN